MRQDKGFYRFLGVCALYFLASNLAHPVTPTLIVERGLDSSLFGVALAAMMTANFLFSPFWGSLCAYVPTRRVLLICCLGYAAGQWVFGAAQSETMVIAGRLLAGVFVGGAFTAQSNYVINTTHDPARQGRNLTLLLTAQNFVGAAGYFVGGLLGLRSVETTFAVQVVLLAAAGLLAVPLCADDTAAKPVPDRPLSLRQANPIAAFVQARRFMTPALALTFAAVAIAGIGQNAFEQCFNYYLRDQFDLSSAYNGIFKAIIAVVSLVVNTTLGLWLQRRTDTRITVLSVLMGCTLPLGAMLLFDSLAPFVVVDVLFFACNALRLPIQQEIAARSAAPEHSNSAMGFYQAMTSLGGIFGALFAGLIYRASPRAPFTLAFAAMAAATAVTALYVLRLRRDKSAL